MMDLSVTPASLVSSVYENLTENIKKLRDRKNAVSYTRLTLPTSVGV